jgi:hypothetical protein
MEQEIARIEKNGQEDMVVRLTNFMDRNLVDIRVWVKDAELKAKAQGFEAKPTKKGITFHIELLPELIKALKKASDVYGGYQPSSLPPFMS